MKMGGDSLEGELHNNQPDDEDDKDDDDDDRMRMRTSKDNGVSIPPLQRNNQPDNEGG